MHRILTDYDPLLLTANKYPFVTRYIGGRVLSFFTLTMVLCSATLIAMSSVTYAQYYPTSESIRDTYLVDGSSVSQLSVVSAFLSNFTTIKTLVDSNVAYARIFGVSESLISVTKVSNSESPYYVKSEWNADFSAVVVSSNKPDCQTSNQYVCDTEFLHADIRDSDWYLAGSTIEDDNLWTRPLPFTNSTTDEISNSVDLIWKSNADDEEIFALTKVSVDLSYLALKADGLLDHEGSERVWLIHRESEEILCGLGVSASEYVSVGSVGAIVTLTSQTLVNISSSLSEGDWIGMVDLWGSDELVLRTGLPSRVSAVIAPLPNSPYSVVVASNPNQFEDPTISTLVLAMIVVASVPLGATLVVLCAYLLRVAVIKRKKLRRRKEVSDAQAAVERAKMHKLAQLESLRTRSMKMSKSSLHVR